MFKKLGIVQTTLKVGKEHRNTFGNYNYRNAEDIVNAAKPLLNEQGLVLLLSDEIKMIGDRYYVEATATIVEIETGKEYKVTASARESLTKKGMDDSQITGSTSSYARKYALNGLFLLDDIKDADSMDNSDKGNKAPSFNREKGIKEIKELIQVTGWNETDALKHYKVSDFKFMKTEVMQKAIIDLKKKLK